jgi:hypothetical protein
LVWPFRRRTPFTDRAMLDKKNHVLDDFLRQISSEMSAEYERIRLRAAEDPGTAGDEGEENWAAILRDWLPRTYEVVTKGRIINPRGETSPQIDVLVLSGSYPQKLLNKKLYLGAGVLAAFECKTTLKASHVDDAVSKCKLIKNLYYPRIGTPFQELHSPIVYGLLAHSHAWKSAKSTPRDNIDAALWQADRTAVTHPREQLDVLCVSDLGTWISHKSVDWTARGYEGRPSASTTYMGHVHDQGQATRFTPIGALISHLSRRLAWEDPSLRKMAEYYSHTNLAGSGEGPGRDWPGDIFDHFTTLVKRERQGSSRDQWDEWGMFFY